MVFAASAKALENEKNLVNTTPAKEYAQCLAKERKEHNKLDPSHLCLSAYKKATKNLDSSTQTANDNLAITSYNRTAFALSFENS